uniref:J domain-containing protein n=1 Tax=viral metagenome TaxID=1070528 RepID=A0A6C0CMJ2_9ZZZZ
MAEEQVPNYYEILGVSKDATNKEIKKQYKKLSMKYHPDRPNGDKTQFNLLNDAFDNLSTHRKRTAYNNRLNGVDDSLNGMMQNVMNMMNKMTGNEGGDDKGLGDIMSTLTQGLSSAANAPSSNEPEDPNKIKPFGLGDLMTGGASGDPDPDKMFADIDGKPEEAQGLPPGLDTMMNGMLKNLNIPGMDKDAMKGVTDMASKMAANMASDPSKLEGMFKDSGFDPSKLSKPKTKDIEHTISVTTKEIFQQKVKKIAVKRKRLFDSKEDAEAAEVTDIKHLKEAQKWQGKEKVVYELPLKEVYNGYEYRFEQQADEQPGHIRGDVVITVEETLDEGYGITRRVGNNLISFHHLTLYDILFSKDIEFQHLDGSNIVVTVTLDEWIQKQGRYELAGRGMTENDSLFVDVALNMESLKNPTEELEKYRDILEKLFS